jgi:two-component system NtrC family sensor kinase
MKFFPQTIRMQIVTAFLVCFVVMAVIIAVNDRNFRRLSHSMQFFEVAQELNSTILEMRRYEKNYFLYRQSFNYEETITYTNQLAVTLERERESLAAAIGRENHQRFVQYVQDYLELMTRLARSDCDAGRCTDLEAKIRGVGQNLVLLADQLLATERRAIDTLLRQMVPLPLISLLALVSLLAFVVFFIGERVVRPLARITRESEAVARGAFEQITAYGGHKNEIHHLVAAINRMMRELEKRQAQLVQSRKIASIGTLTAGIAHEINNPINNISLILESLIEDSERMDDAERRRLYQDAMDQADRTSEIVKNLLEFSRASHPRMETVNIEELVDKTTRLIRNEMNLHNIHLVKQVAPGLPAIYLDKGGIQQVLLNLFMNALQAMDRGGTLQVTADEAQSGHEIRIDVTDTGPGIAPDIIDQIFDPFFTTKKEGVGTGLGLSVSYSIIKKHGGRMEVNSTPGQGTCFTIFLPMAAMTTGNGFDREPETG